METVPAIIDTFTVMYTEAVQAVPQDGKKLDREQKILTSRNQDQQILAAALKALLAKHCTMLASRLESKCECELFIRVHPVTDQKMSNG